ncbi:hypothetical protein ACFOKF_25405 [Sphingobium rhizovicinum]|uniref:Uncharacterized protein n=1 Tax=Sphingobium rhizovicinum TaxID=432308 RepID=A0ABV7NPS1_9SPHN
MGVAQLRARRPVQPEARRQIGIIIAADRQYVRPLFGDPVGGRGQIVAGEGDI